jgi:hypothetical protein
VHVNHKLGITPGDLLQEHSEKTVGALIICKMLKPFCLLVFYFGFGRFEREITVDELLVLRKPVVSMVESLVRMTATIEYGRNGI